MLIKHDSVFEFVITHSGCKLLERCRDGYAKYPFLVRRDPHPGIVYRVRLFELSDTFGDMFRMGLDTFCYKGAFMCVDGGKTVLDEFISHPVLLRWNYVDEHVKLRAGTRGKIIKTDTGVVQVEFDNWSDRVMKTALIWVKPELLTLEMK